MACTDGITANIASTCANNISGGLEVKAWIWNRTGVTLTFSGNSITNITDSGAIQAYTITGVKKLLDAGHDIVVADNRPNKWIHHFMFEQFERTIAARLNVSQLNDVVVCVEAKDKGTGGDGTFFVYGAKHGLYLTGDTQRFNTANGARVIELATQANEEEDYPEYILLKTDYATTLAALNGLLVA
jgi:hypothetical protein